MEDAHETVAHFDGDPSTSFFAVYDGHGGMYRCMLGIYTRRHRRVLFAPAHLPIIFRLRLSPVCVRARPGPQSSTSYIVTF